MLPVVFSDLDGTLLNDNYSFEDVHPVVNRLVDVNVPLVLCSSKTRSEIEYYRRKLNINAPFISENGAAIFIPRGYFKLAHNYTRQTERYDIIELGISYLSIRKKLERIRKNCACEITGFGDMTPEEVAKDGYEALMKGEARIVSGIMNKVQTGASTVLPDSALASTMRYQMEEKSEAESRAPESKL